MLVITRKPGQGFELRGPDGFRIHVMVDNIQGNQAKVSIDAPYWITILRDELRGKYDDSTRSE